LKPDPATAPNQQMSVVLMPSPERGHQACHLSLVAIDDVTVESQIRTRKGSHMSKSEDSKKAEKKKPQKTAKEKKQAKQEKKKNK